MAWAADLAGDSGSRPTRATVWGVDRRIVSVLVLAIGLHAAGLTLVGSTLQHGATLSAVPAMIVRMVTSQVAQSHGSPVVPVEAPEKSVAAPVAKAMAPEAPKSAEPPGREHLPQAAAKVVAPAETAVPAPSSPAASAVTFAPQPPALPPAPDYLSGLKLDPGPQPLHDIVPVYPDEANLREGYVVLRLLIGDTGDVDNVAVVRAYPRGLFEASAVAAFGSAKFSPGRVLGVAVKSQVTLQVDFTPINRGAAVSGTSY
jgi:TonB family protein